MADEPASTEVSVWKGVLTMYIGGGMVVLILVIILLVVFMRR
jgi:hypothetical protein